MKLAIQLSPSSYDQLCVSAHLLGRDSSEHASRVLAAALQNTQSMSAKKAFNEAKLLALRNRGGPTHDRAGSALKDAASLAHAKRVTKIQNQKVTTR
jgi:hypothetical protein